MHSRVVMPHFQIPPRPAVADPARARLRKREAFSLLDRVGTLLEPTATQMERAETSYTAIGAWLSEDVQLADAVIYVQGSIAHGTATRPIGRNEYDVDLICHVPGYGPTLAPAVLKKIVGDRLKCHEVYRRILEEMPRCWRLNYAGDFHLDITPSIANPSCTRGGELVPDRKQRIWKPSNPRGFRRLFARRADMQPTTTGRPDGGRVMGKAEVESFPNGSPVKGVLRRTVQLTKRHRDIDFLDEDPTLAPLSIIITTLGSQAYEWCVRNQAYDNELDLMCDTIRAMPWFIETTAVAGERHWLVENETTEGENFAEKWNSNRRRADSFFRWHARALQDFERVGTLFGLDEVGGSLSAMLGENPVTKALRAMTDEIGEARKASRLRVTPGVGLTTGAVTGTSVRANTFFGR